MDSAHRGFPTELGAELIGSRASNCLNATAEGRCGPYEFSYSKTSEQFSGRRILTGCHLAAKKGQIGEKINNLRTVLRRKCPIKSTI